MAYHRTSRIHHIALNLLLLLLLSTCGYDSSKSSGAGAISFSIDWQEKHARNSSAQGISRKAAQLDCAGTGVSTVEAVVYDGSRNLVASGGPWNCTDHSGSITNVSAGLRDVAVMGKDANGNILYYGEQANVAVTNNETTNAGSITASSFEITNVSATAGNAQVNLTWDSLSGATSYNIYWSTTADVTKSNGTKISSVTSPYAATGLTNWTTYFFVVTAVNSQGESAESAEVSATPTDTVPEAPTGLSAVAGDGEAILSWDSVIGATSYNLYYSTTSGVTKVTGTKVSNVTSSYVKTGLTNWTTYYFVVTAVDSQGESIESAEVSALPPGTSPAAPASVTAIPGDGQNTISWTTSTGATSYNLYYSTISGVTKTTGTRISNVTSPHTVTGLINGATYYYVVTSVDMYGESSASSEVSAAANTISILASGISSPAVIVVDATSAYWTESLSSGAVKKVGLNGGTLTTLASGMNYPYCIAVDSTSVYWGDSSGGLQKVDLNGGSVTALVSGMGLFTSAIFRIDFTSVYWTSGVYVQKVGIDGGTVETLASGGGPILLGIAMDADSVYWGDYGAINKIGINGGTVSTIRTSGATLKSIAVDSTSVYWTESSGGADVLKKMSVNGGTETTIATKLYNTKFLAVDTTNVYWTENNSSGAVKKVGINGGTVTTLATELNYPYGIAIDSTSVYWTENDSTNGAIKKVPK